jgi:hypothetical protein
LEINTITANIPLMSDFELKEPLRHWNNDYLQLDKTSRNIQFILSITDIVTSFTISTATITKDAQEVFTILLNLIRFTGIPKTSRGDCAFNSLKSMAESLGFKLEITTS